MHLAGQPNTLKSLPDAPAFASTPGMATRAASHQFSGRCSAHSGRSIRMSSWGAVNASRHLPLGIHQKRTRASRADINA